MLERQSRGALVFAGDDQSCDLNDLAFTASCGSGLMLGVGEVLEGGGLVAGVGCRDGEDCCIDCVHDGRFRRAAELVLIRC
jgi:hypothetical protein